MTLRLARRLEALKPSPTLAIAQRAAQMRADGVDVISLALGEPDAPTPEAIRRAAKRALDDGHTRYTAAAGIDALRSAIALDYARRGRHVEREQVAVTSGGKQALYDACVALFEPGDRVIIPAPYWVSYPDQVRLVGAEAVTPKTRSDSSYKLRPDQLRALLEDGARALILCSPSNPTGVVYTRDELVAIGEVLGEFPDVIVFFDAMYDRLYYGDGLAPDLIACAPHLEERVVTFNGFSKTYAMTGWRLGYAIGPRPTIEAMITVQSQTASNATSFVQHAGLEALALPDTEIDAMRETFRQRRDITTAALRAVDKLELVEPEGAFYAFPHIEEFFNDRIPDDLALAEHLLEHAHVAVIPGQAFGAPGHLRLSYATDERSLRDALERVTHALRALA